MEHIIRKAVINDMPQVLELIKELALFEKEESAVEVTVTDLEQAGFGNTPEFMCFVVEVDKNIEGVALFYNRYSTWKGSAIHLEDLIVRENMRGYGLGTALLDEVVKYGHNLGVKRICWDVLDWNQPAIDFYKNKGARVLSDWDVVHLDEQGIASYISNL